MQILMCVHFNLRLANAEVGFQDTSTIRPLDNVNCSHMEDVEGMVTDSLMFAAVKLLVFHKVRMPLCMLTCEEKGWIEQCNQFTLIQQSLKLF